MAASTRNTVDKRLEFLETAVKAIGDRLGKIESALGISTEDGVPSKVESRLISLENKAECKCSESRGTELSTSLGTRLTEVENTLGDLSTQVLTVSLKCDDLVEKGNLKSDDSVKKGNLKCEALPETGNFSVAAATQKGTEQDRSKGGSEGVGSAVVEKLGGNRVNSAGLKFVVVGDSLARGAGYKFKKQCPDEVEVKAVGGAKLGRVREEIRGMKEDKSKVLVVVAGANNMVDDDATSMIKEYSSLVEDCKKVTDKVVVVGLIKRYDLGPWYEDKRITINYRLKKESKPDKMNFAFVEYEPERNKVYGDGLHLNGLGQNELGKIMYRKCVDFLE